MRIMRGKIRYDDAAATRAARCRQRCSFDAYAAMPPLIILLRLRFDAADDAA